MKYMGYFLLVVVLSFIGLVVYNSYYNSTKLNSEENVYNKENLHQTTIDQLGDENYKYVATPDEISKKVASGELIYVYFYSPTCSYCKKATPKVVKAIKEAGVELNQYNILEYEQGWKDYQIEGTPTLIAFKDNQEINRYVGDASKESFSSFIEVTNSRLITSKN